MVNTDDQNLREIKILAEAKLPMDNLGVFHLKVFSYGDDSKEHVVLTKNLKGHTLPLVRIHSECLTGDVFASLRCDCGEQLSSSLKKIATYGGALIYLRQEGRGIGLVNKIKAYALQQEKGYDTVEANQALGFKTDERDFLAAGSLLTHLGIKKIKLLTNNPQKIADIEACGIEVIERLPVEGTINQQNCDYLKTKKDKLGHLFEF